MGLLILLVDKSSIIEVMAEADYVEFSASASLSWVVENMPGCSHFMTGVGNEASKP